MKTLLFILGTRPEAIKLAPVILEANNSKVFRTEVILSSQHPEMCVQTLNTFGITPTIVLNGFENGQSLVSFSSKVLGEIAQLDLPWKESIVIVQGDTTTATMGAYAGFLMESKVAHVEAGLRTYERDPFPEEMNRVLISKLANFHFCATEGNSQNLRTEGILQQQIAVVGNTVIDAINFFKVKRSVGKIINQLANEFDSQFEWKFIKHPNPMAQAGYDSDFKSNPNIRFLDPLPYPEMLAELSKSYLVLTDSGGFQEESTYLGIPTLVLRKTTERPEAISSGCCELIPDPVSTLSTKTRQILTNKSLHQQMSRPSEIFGVGMSAKKIIDVLKTL